MISESFFRGGLQFELFNRMWCHRRDFFSQQYKYNLINELEWKFFPNKKCDFIGFIKKNLNKRNGIHVEAQIQSYPDLILLLKEQANTVATIMTTPKIKNNVPRTLYILERFWCMTVSQPTLNRFSDFKLQCFVCFMQQELGRSSDLQSTGPIFPQQ